MADLARAMQKIILVREPNDLSGLIVVLNDRHTHRYIFV
jgi:hypothetical protein